ncbi:hypothetical protein V5799_017363 [Amblyomma americanum]|uniref:G-protein coupled receptors family 1 profile domain-containing protein n=1 Tax=Amblyomma americanum TaxID=6943 RepID=A0AAQ4F2F8_AMBAM
MEHPARPGFYQCVTFASFPSPAHEKVYNLLCLLALYGVPLAAIVLCYSRIFLEIQRQSKEGQGEDGSEAQGGGECTPGRLRLRRSDMRHMLRARNRTLRLTIVIVLAFFLCWTPYVTMVLWYQIDPSGAEGVNDYLQSSLFMFAVSNSCVNPLVYGSYTKSFKRILGQACCWLRKVQRGCCPHYAKTQTPLQASRPVKHEPPSSRTLVDPVSDVKKRCLLCGPHAATAQEQERQIYCCSRPPAPLRAAYMSTSEDAGDCSVLWKPRSYSTRSHGNSAVTVLQNSGPCHDRSCHNGRSAVRRDPCSL